MGAPPLSVAAHLYWVAVWQPSVLQRICIRLMAVGAAPPGSGETN